MKSLDQQISADSKRRLECFVTDDPLRIEAAQRLRYKVFAQEMGARLKTRQEGVDCDEIDDYCDHLIVLDKVSDRIVGYTRLLNQKQAQRLGRFYSQAEFNLERVLALPGRFLEIGRTCVDSNYRGSAVLTTLWSGLVKYTQAGRYDYMIGCASISPGPNGFAVDAVYRNIGRKNRGSDDLNVTPRRPIPGHLRCERDESGIPPLLKAYLRFGVMVCGQPYWDEDFNVMDLFILLPLSQLEDRYTKHYFKPQSAGHEIQA